MLSTRETSLFEKIQFILQRKPVPSSWVDDVPLPYQNRSLQMQLLKEQINHSSDRGSRKSEDIALHCEWIRENLLQQENSKILDLGCGPGYYSHYLGTQKNYCYGIDVSELAIEYAQSVADDEGLNCKFIVGDFLTTFFPVNMDLVIMPYSIFNQFSFSDANRLIRKIVSCLKKGGRFYLEAMTFNPPITSYQSSWYTTTTPDFFSADPYLCLMEQFWDPKELVTIHRYYLINYATGSMTTHVTSLQNYTQEHYLNLLKSHGLIDIVFPAPPPGTHKGDDRMYMAMYGNKL